MTTSVPISPRFIASIRSNLRYWHSRVLALDDQRYPELDPEIGHLIQAFQYGISLADTWKPAILLGIDLVNFIEARGIWTLWIPVFDGAIEAAPLKNASLFGAFACRLGFLYRLDNQLKPALELHQLALEISQQQKDDREIGFAHLGLADEYYLMRDYPRAEEHAQKGLQYLADGRKLDHRIRSGINLLGMIAHDRGEYIKAKSFYQNALVDWPAEEFPRKKALTLVNLANTLRDMREFPAAHAALDEAQDLALMAKNQYLLIQILNVLGTMQFAMEAWDEAETTFRAIDIHFLTHYGFKSLLATVSNNLGNVYLKKKNLGQAQESLSFAVGLWRELNDEINLANTLGDLGEVSIGLGNASAAQPFIEEALRLLQKYPDNSWAQKRRRAIQALQVSQTR